MKLEINSRKTQICEIRQHTLEQGMVKEEITERTKKYLVTNVNKNTACQNLHDAAKAVLV